MCFQTRDIYVKTVFVGQILARFRCHEPILSTKSLTIGHVLTPRDAPESSILQNSTKNCDLVFFKKNYRPLKTVDNSSNNPKIETISAPPKRL